MKGKRSRIFQDSNKTKRNKNREEKDEGSTRLANFQKVKKFLRLANYYSVRIQDNKLDLFYCPCSFLFYLLFIFLF